MRLLALAVLLLAGCSTINVTATCPENADGVVWISIEQPKTVSTSPAIQGNVPLAGGTVASPTLTNK